MRYGGYDNIIGGKEVEALVDLTGRVGKVTGTVQIRYGVRS